MPATRMLHVRSYRKKSGKVCLAPVAAKQRECVTRISGSYKKLLSPLCFKVMLSVIFAVKTVPLRPIVFLRLFAWQFLSPPAAVQGKGRWRGGLCLLKGFQVDPKCQRTDQTRASLAFACLSPAHCMLLLTPALDQPLQGFSSLAG